MDTKINRFKDLEWWIVPKRLIYIVLALVGLSLLAGGAGVYVWINGNPFAGPQAEAGAPTGARFTSFEGGVRVVRANTREITQARSDTRLFPGDIVQTQEDGRARISFADGSTLFVKPNSVITIAENTGTEDGKSSKVRVVVESGQVNVRTEQQPEAASNIVATQLTESRLNSETDASFDVRGDKSEAIRVATGKIETSTRNGDVTTLQGGTTRRSARSGASRRMSDCWRARPVTLQLNASPRARATPPASPALAAPGVARPRPTAQSPLALLLTSARSERDHLRPRVTVDSLLECNSFWPCSPSPPSVMLATGASRRNSSS